MRWLFFHHAPEGWAWQHRYPNGHVENGTGTHETIGAAIDNAILHGFSPSKDFWIVDQNIQAAH